MMTILLYGFLGKQFGKVHRYDVKTPAEAIKAMCATLKGFRKAVVDGGEYKVIKAGRDSLDVEGLSGPFSQRDSLRIIPVISGSNSPWVNIIVGAVLIWASSGTYGWNFFAAGGAGAAYAGAVAAVGVSLVMSGISQLLAPQLAAKDNMDPVNNRASFAFDGAVNTIAQGNPVPVCYGKLIVGSQIISAGLAVEQI